MNEIIAIDRNAPDESVLRHAAEVVRGGGLIVYPTETLYGIGADVTNPMAVGRINAVKQRPDTKPILMIVSTEEMMRPYIENVSPAARVLMEKFWPGPLTLVFKGSAQVPAGLTRESGTVGIRIPSSNICLGLLALLGVPLTSTSANRAGEAPARTIGEIQQQLEGVDLFLDAGELPESQPSTVVDVSGAIPRVLRSGAIGSDQIKQLLPNVLT
jgi:L-threonylcarbamoyladenylate synthase